MTQLKVPIYWINHLPDPSITILRYGAIQRERIEKINKKRQELEKLLATFHDTEIELHGLVSAAYTEQEIDQANADYTRTIKSNTQSNG